MTERAEPGTWVEIGAIVLEPGRRAQAVPEDTQKTALEMRVKGFLVCSASLSDEAEVVTASDRHVRGTLMCINPAYSHGFGQPIPELLTIGREVRALLADEDGNEGVGSE